MKLSERFEFLDGLRGIAAVFVVLFHFNGSIKEHLSVSFPLWLDWIFSQGYFGVQIFFVLSGFVIAYSIRHEHVTPSFFLRFFLRRSIRLDPPYWMTVALIVVLAVVASVIKQSDHLEFTPQQIFLNLIYLPDLMGVDRILPVAWTLCMEFQLYMTFVLLIGLIQSISTTQEGFYRSMSCLGIFGMLAVISALQHTSFAVLPPMPALFITYWYSFFLGCLTCWSICQLVDVRFFWINCGVLGVCGMASLNTQIGVTLLIALIIYAVARAGKLHEYLNGEVFQYLGKISYSLYLIHWPFGMKFLDLSIRFLSEYLSNLWAISLLMVVSFGLTILAAHLFYQWVEYPSLKMSKMIRKHAAQLELKILADQSCGRIRSND